MKANKGQVERAMDSPSDACRLFLLYGADESGSRALIQRLVRAMGPDAERIDLDNKKLSADPALLADEAASISLFGGRRYIVVTVSGNDDCLPAVESLLSADKAGNPVVLLAGALKATSPLLKRLLPDPATLCLISYVPDDRTLAEIATQIAREQGLRLVGDTARHLVKLGGGDRAVMAQEITKLALYKDADPASPKDASVDDVDAIGAGNGEPDLSGLSDAVMSGKVSAMAAQLAVLASEGVEGIPALRAVNRRAHQLLKFKSELAAGRSMDDVTKAVFFKEKAAIQHQLGRWPADRLATVAERLLEAERAIKGAASIGPLLADAELVRIARAVRG
jgi:DNA polymerase III subunit delta